VTAVSQVMPGWVLSLLALSLILPAVVASVDAFARARRRREPVVTWLRWLGVPVLALVTGLIVAVLLTLAGIGPDPPPAPVAPAIHPLDGAAVAALAVTAAAVALAWVVGRRLALRRSRGSLRPAAPGAACVTALVLSLAALVAWVFNPFAALLLAPTVHLWTLATASGPAVTRRGRVLLAAVGALLPVGIAAYYLIRLSLDPLEGAWYLFLVVTGHHVGVIGALLGCVLLGVLAAVVAIVVAHREAPAPAPEGPRLRGPPTYAGPGSLGGTDSALRR
jgi:hypothetical protein